MEIIDIHLLDFKFIIICKIDNINIYIYINNRQIKKDKNACFWTFRLVKL